VREVNEIAPGQYRFGQEHPLQFKGVSSGNMTGAPAGGGALATAPRRSHTYRFRRRRPRHPRSFPNEPDACQGRPLLPTPVRSSPRSSTRLRREKSTHGTPSG
jgi:hypothetical protein